MKSKLTFIHALSPLHAGTGQGVGVIDLPIAREKATNIPFLPGSSVKGTLRDEFNDDPNQEKIFGPENSTEYAGAIQFTDQTLLCLPVRSLAGTFAYVTSPYILKRLMRDANLLFDVPDVADANCIVGSDSELPLLRDTVCLEDLDLNSTRQDSDLANWIKERVFADVPDWQAIFSARFCVVSDNVFAFLLNTATEVTARIRIQNETKTTANGALWYEESLPTESILFGLALAFPNERTELKDTEIFEYLKPKCEGILQFGGNATVGRGLCRLRFAEIEARVDAATGGN